MSQRRSEGSALPQQRLRSQGLPLLHPQLAWLCSAGSSLLSPSLRRFQGISWSLVARVLENRKSLAWGFGFFFQLKKKNKEAAEDEVLRSELRSNCILEIPSEPKGLEMNLKDKKRRVQHNLGAGAGARGGFRPAWISRLHWGSQGLRDAPGGGRPVASSAGRALAGVRFSLVLSPFQS